MEKNIRLTNTKFAVLTIVGVIYGLLLFIVINQSFIITNLSIFRFIFAFTWSFACVFCLTLMIHIDKL